MANHDLEKLVFIFLGHFCSDLGMDRAAIGFLDDGGATDRGVGVGVDAGEVDGGHAAVHGSGLWRIVGVARRFLDGRGRRRCRYRI